MANIKKLSSAASESGKTTYDIVRRNSDSFRLNDADGAYAAAPADPYLSLAEDAVIKGLYEVSENRTVWTDGKYTVTSYIQRGGAPAPATDTIFGVGILRIVNDLIVDNLTVDDVWDEVLTAATHNVSASAGRRLRNVSSVIITDGTCPSAPLQSNQVILNGDAFSTDGAYDPAGIAINTGTGEGQARLILQYDGATKTATLDRNWKVDPDDTSEYIVFADAGREHVNEGLAQAGSSLSTIKLNALASDDDDAYRGQTVFLRSGMGEDQARKITSYDGTTKIATVERNWDHVPDGTTAYVMLPTGGFDTVTLISSIWNALTSAFTVVGSIGKLIVDFLDVAVSSRATSTDVTGAVTTGVILTNFPVTDGGEQRIQRGDVTTITLNAGSAWDFTGKRVFFTMKPDKFDGLGAATYKVNREATIAQASPGIATFTFTILESDTEDIYDAEFTQYDADGVSNPLTITADFKVRVTQDVRQ